MTEKNIVSHNNLKYETYLITFLKIYLILYINFIYKFYLMLYNILILINISVIDKKKSFIFESHIINITMLLTFIFTIFFEKQY